MVKNTMSKGKDDDLRFLTGEVYKKMSSDDSVDKYVVWVQMNRINETKDS